VVSGTAVLLGTVSGTRLVQFVWLLGVNMT